MFDITYRLSSNYKETNGLFIHYLSMRKMPNVKSEAKTCSIVSIVYDLKGMCRLDFILDFYYDS